MTVGPRGRRTGARGASGTVDTGAERLRAAVERIAAVHDLPPPRWVGDVVALRPRWWVGPAGTRRLVEDVTVTDGRL